MTASPVVDLDVWRERARVVRSAEPPAALAAVAPPVSAPPAANGATVLRMPAPAAGPGPVSPFGPVMAFGLVRRTAPAAAALPRAPEVPHVDPLTSREAPHGPPVLTVLPPLSTQPGVTSAPTPRLRTVPDTRGTPRGPRR